MIFLEPIARSNSKRYEVTVTFLYHANDARTHAYDMLGIYHKNNHSVLVCDLVNLVPRVLAPPDQRSENESSGSNHFEITEFW